MSSSTALTGRNGKFTVAGTQVARTTKWAVNDALATKSEWGDSDSAGFTNRAAGRKDATFDAEGKFDNTNKQFSLFRRGDIAHAVLWMDYTPHSDGTTGSNLYWDFPRALCLDFKLDVNIDTEEVESWTSSWGADGVYYAPGEAGASTQTIV